MKRREKGLTLIELMVTLAVAIVILAIGIPAFNAMSARDMSAATVNALVTALQQARVEAISRGRVVSLVSSNWNQGWSIEWVNSAGATEVLRAFVAPRSAQVTVSATLAATPLTFTSLGETAGNSVFTISTFKTADTTGTPVRVRFICVTNAGQIRTEDVKGNCP